MSKELKLYKAFIDGLVDRKDSMTARWVKGDGFQIGRASCRERVSSPV